jgi:hypothetical protein
LVLGVQVVLRLLVQLDKVFLGQTVFFPQARLLVGVTVAVRKTQVQLMGQAVVAVPVVAVVALALVVPLLLTPVVLVRLGKGMPEALVITTPDTNQTVVGAGALEQQGVMEAQQRLLTPKQGQGAQV